MTEVQALDPAGVPKPLAPYSTMTIFGDLVFLAGHLALDLDGNPLPDLSAGEQTDKALDYMSIALESAESDMDHLLKVTIYVASLDDFPEINAAYAKHFPSHKPTRATVEVSRIIGDLRVEIEAIAARRN